MYTIFLGNFLLKERWLAKKTTAFKYTLAWSKLYSFVDIKFFIVITYNKVEEPQITDTEFMVTIHSGEFSLLIKTTYWKRVVSETGIWAFPKTIKNRKFYRNVISPGPKLTEWTKNKWT